MSLKKICSFVVRNIFRDTTVFPGTLQIICHYHFVRDLGDAVFADYTTFRNYVVKTKALSSISKIDNNAYEDGIRKAETVWAGIASEYILYPREIASKFPFALPYIDVVGRSIEIMHLAKRIVKWNILHNTFCTPLMKLLEKLTILTENEDVNTGYHVFQKMWEWFELVRKTLRVCREMNSAASQEPVAADQTRKDLVSVINEIAYQGTKSGSYLERKSMVIKNRVEAHLDELTAPVVGTDGKIIDIVRHNGVEEIGHRWSRMHIKRRTGRSQTSAEMAKYESLLAVLSNIENKVYIQKVIAKMNFVEELADLSKKRSRRGQETHQTICKALPCAR